MAATFLKCGADVERLPDVACSVGATRQEIGNHNRTHPLFCFRSPAFMEADLACVAGPSKRSASAACSGVYVAGGDDRHRSASGAPSNGAIICQHDGRQLRATPDIGGAVEAVRCFGHDAVRSGV